MSTLRWVLGILGAGTSAVIALFLTARALARACGKLRALGARLVSDPERESKHYPGLPSDGSPLSVPERERLEQIRQGIWKTASEPRRSR